jgi:hypothetical protein
VVIGLERLNLFNCKYNLLWLQKSLTSGNLGLVECIPFLCSISRFQGFPFFCPLDQQCFQMSLIACSPGQQLLVSLLTGCDRRRDCRALQWPCSPSLWLLFVVMPNLTGRLDASGSLNQAFMAGGAVAPEPRGWIRVTITNPWGPKRHTSTVATRKAGVLCRKRSGRAGEA